MTETDDLIHECHATVSKMAGAQLTAFPPELLSAVFMQTAIAMAMAVRTPAEVAADLRRAADLIIAGSSSEAAGHA